MRNVMRWVVGAAMVLAAGAWLGTVDVQAQARAAQAPQDVQQADDVRREFRQLLEQFPPALGVVLKSDPTLLTNPAYLTSYPGLAQFITAHPEVPRDPSYFLEHVETRRGSDENVTLEGRLRIDAINMWRNTMSSFLFLGGFVATLLTMAWVIRYIVDHRRWLRASKIQSEAHNKLLERFTTGDELAAYVQSPAGAQFLQAAPLTTESSVTRVPGAPFSRILWSVQAGVVLVAAGVGFLLIQQRTADEVAQMMGAWGMFAIAVGVGFVVSGGLSYLISSRMGLLGDPKA